MRHRRLHLIVFGAQGVGKGTQAKILAERFGLVHANTGERLREMAEEQSAIGARISETLKRGHLVSDELATEMIELQVGGIPPDTGFVLDGYPRNLYQAEQLHRILAGLGRLDPKPVFINFEVPQPKLVERLLKRREIEGRHDDIEPVIKQRHELYQEQTEPVLDAVKDWADIVQVDGDQLVGAVAEETIRKLPNAEG
ncbi:MAG: nucleoside monophosphate kinase [bacterium]|nr:nucleoside monophosphate kinase [bacterium]